MGKGRGWATSTELNGVEGKRKLYGVYTHHDIAFDVKEKKNQNAFFEINF
jgi:hypothetical protein